MRLFTHGSGSLSSECAWIEEHCLSAHCLQACNLIWRKSSFRGYAGFGWLKKMYQFWYVQVLDKCAVRTEASSQIFCE